MAPPSGYLDTYKSYKAGTTKVTTWLVDNAKRCGAAPSKHPIPVNEFPKLARSIAASTSPIIRIPNHVVTLIKSVINLRKQFTYLFTKFSKRKDAAARAARDGHQHFISVLEDVLSILRPSDLDDVMEDDLSNVFAALHVEETNSEDPVPARSKTAKSAKPKEYEIEIESDEPTFAIFSFFKDFNDIRTHLQGVWADYRSGKLDLMAASITTDTAFNMI